MRAKKLVPNGKIRSALRWMWFCSWQRKEALKRAHYGSAYVCKKCTKLYKQKQVEVDHIVPVGHSASWGEYITKLFCAVEGLRVVCKTCHKRITAASFRS